MSGQKWEPKTPAERKLYETAIRVRTVNTAIELWDSVFTESDRKRLGGNFATAFNGDRAVKMWKNLHGCTDVRAIIDIAFAVNFLTSSHREWLLRETGEILDAEAAFEDAIIRNELVLNSHTREVYWKGEAINLEWHHDAKWSYIWALAKEAKAGLCLDRWIFAREKNESYLSKMKTELAGREEFPDELACLIEPDEPGTQRLHLPPEEIRLFEHYVGGEIREWTP